MRVDVRGDFRAGVLDVVALPIQAHRFVKIGLDFFEIETSLRCFGNLAGRTCENADGIFDLWPWLYAGYKYIQCITTFRSRYIRFVTNPPPDENKH